MNKLSQTFQTFFNAGRYSFSFCLKNNKRDTVARIIFTMLSALSSYFVICCVGLIISSVQQMLRHEQKITVSFYEAVIGGLLNPVFLLLGVLLSLVFITRFEWFFSNRWRRIMRFANERDINDFRSTLDAARFKSSEYDDLSKRILELPMAWQTRFWFAEEMFALTKSCISFVLFGCSLLFIAPAYAGVIMLSCLPFAIIEFKLVGEWWNLFEKMVPHNKKRSTLHRAFYSANAFIQALMFHQMPSLRKAIDANTGVVIREYSVVVRKTVRHTLFSHTIAVIGLGGVILHAVWSLLTQGGDIGTLAIVIASARAFHSNMEDIVGQVAEQWNCTKGVILIEEEFFGLRPMVVTENPVSIPREFRPKIRFERVSFAYPGQDTLVLKEVSFSIRQGSKTAIVGESGNGKSTISALLMRHYDPASGAIFADDISLGRIKPEDWTNVIAGLTQEYSILERLVGEEIASSRMGSVIDPEDLASSARFANFLEVVETEPAGFNTQIGVEFGGKEFSGGEKQRLALARVHYRGTPILVLDEPDAKLDPSSAQKVLQNIFGLKGVTVILITHHVANTTDCDQIIVMGKGEVAEMGTPDELIARDGVYAKMLREDRRHKVS